MERVMSGNWLCSEPKPRQAEAGAILEVWHNQLDCHCNAKLANARSAMTLGGMPGREGGEGLGDSIKQDYKATDRYVRLNQTNNNTLYNVTM